NPSGFSDHAQGAFTYVRFPPDLVSLSPSVGPLGGNVDVILSGHEFGDGASVFFGGLPAPSVWIDAKTVRATVPPTTSAVTASVDVTIVNADNQSDTLVGAFTYDARFQLGLAPGISALTPAKGPAGGGTKLLL